MHLSIHNLTEETLLATPHGEPPTSILPSQTAELVIHGRTLLVSIAQSDNASGGGGASVNAYSLALSAFTGAYWTVVDTPARCPWRLYRMRLTRDHHKISILPYRDPSNFLSCVPDSVPLSSLLLPGTHQTMAYYGWPFAQCQSRKTSLAVQLASGIRVLDIRLALVDGKLVAYHDVIPQKTFFAETLSVLRAFLVAEATCRETVVMSIKQEDFRTTPGAAFSASVRREIEESSAGREGWFLENRVPSLGEVRGKIVLFSRFGEDGEGWEGGLEGLGIHPSRWPDSEELGFTWFCKNTLVRTHDWYRVPSLLSIPEKVDRATRVLLPPENELPVPCLNISFLSASTIPLALPPTIARGFGWPRWGLGIEGVNARFGRWLLERLTEDAQDAEKSPLPLKLESSVDEKPHVQGELRVRGWVLMDFYTYPEDKGVVPLLIELNFRGRRRGEEGW